MHKWFAALVFTGTLVGAFVFSGHPLLAIDPPSFALVVSLTLAILIGRHGFGVFKEWDEEAVKTLGYAALIAGVIGTIVGLILLFALLDAFKWDPFGPAFSTALVPLFYGLCIYLFSFVFRGE